MKRHNTTFTLIVLALGFAIWIYISIQNDIKNAPLKNPGSLRVAIMESITNPFPQADTLILNTTWFICGNSRPEEIPDIFNTYIDSSFYKNKLAEKLHIAVLNSHEFDKVMDTVRESRYKGEYPASLWDTCRVGKVVAGIAAEQLTSTKVKLEENYKYNNEIKSIEKEFTFQNDHWSYNIVGNSPGKN